MYSNKLFANNNTALWDLVAKYTINIPRRKRAGNGFEVWKTHKRHN